MDEYIKREAAIAVIYGQHIGGKEACENARPNTYGADLREIVADIEDIPAADVQPVRHGRWRLGGYGQISDATTKWYDQFLQGGFLYCSVCRERSNRKTPYCPTCGTKMGGA